MNILIVCLSKLPASLYGGTERVVWDLAKELVGLNNKVKILALKGSKCSFAEILEYNPDKSINSQIPENIDVVHFNSLIKEAIEKPYILTVHGNGKNGEKFDKNSVFVSKNHAKRHNSDSFVYNGLNWTNFDKPDLDKNREYFHFLGNAAWKVKNRKGASKICRKANEQLVVIGGKRINTKMGIKISTCFNTKFMGLLNDSQKADILNKSKGFIFPVLWHEPFGLAIIESMYFGCPVIGTKYGSLPELIGDKYGYTSNNITDLVNAVKNIETFSKKEISEYAKNMFNSKLMAESYLKKYEHVLNNNYLNKTCPEMITDN